MWFAVGYMPAPSRRQPPECVRACPMAVPFRRYPDRLESDLMRHDPARLQPARHPPVSARQITDELEYSLREYEIHCSVPDHVHGPRSAVTDQPPVAGRRPWIGHGGPDPVEPRRDERGLQARRRKKIWKAV